MHTHAHTCAHAHTHARTHSHTCTACLLCEHSRGRVLRLGPPAPSSFLQTVGFQVIEEVLHSRLAAPAQGMHGDVSGWRTAVGEGERNRSKIVSSYGGYTAPLAYCVV